MNDSYFFLKKGSFCPEAMEKAKVRDSGQWPNFVMTCGYFYLDLIVHIK